MATARAPEAGLCAQPGAPCPQAAPSSGSRRHLSGQPPGLQLRVLPGGDGDPGRGEGGAEDSRRLPRWPSSACATACLESASPSRSSRWPPLFPGLPLLLPLPLALCLVSGPHVPARPSPAPPRRPRGSRLHMQPEPSQPQAKVDAGAPQSLRFLVSKMGDHPSHGVSGASKSGHVTCGRSRVQGRVGASGRGAWAQPRRAGLPQRAHAPSCPTRPGPSSTFSPRSSRAGARQEEKLVESSRNNCFATRRERPLPVDKIGEN